MRSRPHRQDIVLCRGGWLRAGGLCRDTRIDNAKFKAHFHTKAKMLSPEEVVAFTGHAVGGVCPFAIENPAVTVWLDISLRRFATVFPAAGSSNSAIELTPEELEEYAAAAGWVDVCKNWE